MTWLDPHGFTVKYLNGMKDCIDMLATDQIAEVANCILQAYRTGKLIALMGNGGSAATASHIACDFGKTILGDQFHRTRFRVMSLTDNVPGISAWANDVGYDTIFAEQIRAWINPGDIVIAISGSGNSPNILRGIEAAKQQGAFTIGLLGFNGGQAASMVDLPVIVRSTNYGYIEDMHMMFGHLITAYIREIIQNEEKISVLSQ